MGGRYSSGWGTIELGENGVNVKGRSGIGNGSTLYLLCLWMRV